MDFSGRKGCGHVTEDPAVTPHTEPLYLRSLIDALLVSVAPAIAEEELTQLAKAFSSALILADALSQRFAQRLLFLPRLLLKFAVRCRKVIPKRRQCFDQFAKERRLIGTSVRRHIVADIPRIIMRGHDSAFSNDGNRASSESLAWIIHERVATVVPERDRRVVFGGVGDAVIEV